MKPALRILIFFVSLVVSSLLLSFVLPPPSIPQFDEKIAWFTAHKDEYDAVFVGSSQFFHGIVPRQFDREAGREVRTFNFGLDGLWPAESFYVLRQIMALHPRRLRWVFINWMDIDPRIDADATSFTTRRMLYWHDTRHTAMTLQRIAETSDSWIEKTRLSGAHLVLWARCLAHHGQAVDWLNARLRRGKRLRARISEWAAQDGWQALENRSLEGGALADYSVQFDRLRTAGPRPPMSAVFERAVRDIVAEVRASGATPILIASPAADTRHRFAPPAGIEAWIFNDPERHPGLFEPSLRFDNYHLNPRGAECFTRLLAERFAETPR